MGTDDAGAAGSGDLKAQLSFKLSGAEWKEAFALPSGVFCKGCHRFYPWMRLAIFFVWLAVSCWSIGGYIQKNEVKTLHRWFCKLTHWGVITELVYFGLAAYTTFKARAAVTAGAASVDDDTAGPFVASVAWCLSAAVPTVSAGICLLYWTLEYGQKEKTQGNDGGVQPKDGDSALKYFTHGLNFILALVDLVSTRQPCYVEHVYVPVLYTGAYSAFTYVFFLSDGLLKDDGKPGIIYGAINWERSAKKSFVMVVCITLVLAPLLYAIFFGVARCRDRCSRDSQPFDSASDCPDKLGIVVEMVPEAKATKTEAAGGDESLV